MAFLELLREPSLTNAEVGKRAGLSANRVHCLRKEGEWDKEIVNYGMALQDDLAERMKEEALAFKSARLREHPELEKALQALWKRYFRELEDGSVEIIRHYKPTKFGDIEVLPHILINGYMEARRSLIEQAYRITGESHRERSKEREAGADKVFAPITINQRMPEPVSKTVSKGRVVEASIGEIEEKDSHSHIEGTPRGDDHPPSEPGPKREGEGTP